MAESGKIRLFDPALPASEHRRLELLRAYPEPEAESGPDLRAYWRILFKRRWTVLSIALVAFTIVTIATVKEKPVYRASAMLEIEQENPNIVTVQELFQLQNVSDDYLETQYKILQSDSLARAVIGKLHLDTVAEFKRRRSSRFIERQHHRSGINEQCWISDCGKGRTQLCL
jgi:uncharacterized protein involved in exopolysaccharide biosynthesis